MMSSLRQSQKQARKRNCFSLEQRCYDIQIVSAMKHFFNIQLLLKTHVLLLFQPPVLETKFSIIQFKKSNGIRTSILFTYQDSLKQKLLTIKQNLST